MITSDFPGLFTLVGLTEVQVQLCGGPQLQRSFEGRELQNSALMKPAWVQVVPVDSGVWVQSTPCSRQSAACGGTVVGGEEVGLGKPGCSSKPWQGSKLLNKLQILQ